MVACLCRTPVEWRAVHPTTPVGVFGASGYAGAELLRLLSAHPDFRAVLATADTQAGGRVADLYPSLAAAYPDLMLTAADPALADGLDVVFLALPHGASQELVPELRKRVGTVVDLAADFRLRDPALYPRWYGARAPLPRPAGRGGHRHPRVVPRRPARRHPDRGGRLLSDCGRAGPGAPGPGRA